MLAQNERYFLKTTTRKFIFKANSANLQKLSEINKMDKLIRYGQRCHVSMTHGSKHDLYGGVSAKIGLEVHAQLNTKSKLFSQGGNVKSGRPNTQLDLLDISLPGSLPKLNKEALRMSILSSLGLNCKIQDTTHFDRKNYFYADMPAGFQITQYNRPIAKNGFIDFIVTTYHNSIIAHAQQYDIVKYLYHEDRENIEEVKPYIMRSQIKQIQLEQDSAKTLQQTTKDSEEEQYSLIDYNRSGAGLIEIVFEPDLTNHHEASSLIKELINLLKALKVCDCELQEGSLRVDANISIQAIENQIVDGSAKVELKNLNSIRSLNKGIRHEIIRQASLIKSGGPVVQETRTFDTRTGKTIPLRFKEEASDYRYMPEPSIPPIAISGELIDDVQKSLPNDLPSTIRKNILGKYDVDLALVTEIIDEPDLHKYFLEIMEVRPNYNPNVIADFLIYSVANIKNIVGPPIHVDLSDETGEFRKRIGVETLISIFDMMLEDEISFMTAYEVMKFKFVNNDESSPKEIIEHFGWQQINDRAIVMEMCNDTSKKMRNVSKCYRKRGEKRYLRMMVEKLCELTNNRISVKMAIECLNELLRPGSLKSSETTEFN